MPRPPKQKQNPISAAVSSWLDSLPPALLSSLLAREPQLLRDRAPKRWVVYEPMVLLPSGSFAAAPWPALLDSLTPAQSSALWAAILRQLSPAAPKPPLTHLAINERIPLRTAAPSPPSPPNPAQQQQRPPQPEKRQPSHHQQAAAAATTAAATRASRREDEAQANAEENILRSPTHLRPLHGCFGPPPPPPPPPLRSSRADANPPPLPADFAAALWVSTTQNGLRQVWAPRHTMFSRGNVKEKARILGTGVGSRSKWAVDLYAGIGYFAFSYARLGLRVLCWELNPWSVEGLRRGAEANGFSVRIVRAPPPWDGDGDGDLDLVALLGEEEDGEAPQIVVFLEDNRLAAGRIRRARAAGVRLEVVHVNCGFLPSSEGVWRDAWEIQTGGGGSCAGAGEGVGWLHLHENVGAADIERRKADVQGLFDRWKQQDGNGSTATVEHVELVKTYAPGVWHCVFDVCITRSNAAE
ncbi:uncharacterized protein THITE_50004 [Thermothielavioides terrestris NRRL 8126]|uniref:tRNA wybutosine-synthesizing protein 2 n=1 Tax=Thermothielavioides terrestris (strain ATCC 38088 / NRRL 8126) TaxID=578455 RepID=G2RH65_THETT|nr:uncharacterized protein THITE_50004 [Thermothielavioides terrestris NRRL 8126]AEO71177.1 hypothetical protein THITE_50004 [Thermothielavioides terrestris NRRL 8126]